jgi:hypothetical protein
LKDLDFFFYGDNHYEHFHTVLKQTLEALKEFKPHCKFLMLFKPLFNVFEVICITDPSDFIHDDYILDNFTHYQFKSLHRYDKYTIIDPLKGKIYRKKGWKTNDVTNQVQKKFEKLRKLEEAGEITDAQRKIYEEDFVTIKDLESPDFSNYFEDNDATGIRMNYRIQFILSKFAKHEDIFKSFDMYPCMVSYDGEQTRFIKDSYLAYKYMINMANEAKYSTLFSHRLCKYFDYGFKIGMPDLDLDALKHKTYFKIPNEKAFSFKLVGIHNNVVTVEHNSHMVDKINSIIKLEKKASADKDVLYKSSLFCSLISILRYVKINKINYIFSKDVLLPDPKTGFLKFRESEIKVEFIDKINSRIDGHDFYGKFRKTKEKEETLVNQPVNQSVNRPVSHQTMTQSLNSAVGTSSEEEDSDDDSY